MTTGGTGAGPRIESLVSILGRFSWCAFVVVAVLGGYTLLALPVTAWVPDPVAATMAVGGIVALVVGSARLLRPRWLAYAPGSLCPDDARRSLGFWSWALLAVLLAFLAGQTIALMLYGLVGSAGFDQHLEAEQASGHALVLTLTLVVAPLSEEALFRGLAYPLLRRRADIVTSMTITALLFACMHGNLVQAAVTAPLGLVLALVAERTRRLWQVVVLHAAYNLAATLISPQAVQALATPQCAALLAAAWAVCLAYLFVRVRSSGTAARPG